jgi:hypothetical protein
MEKYLVGISYHEADYYESSEKEIYEDYESSTGIFITANSPEEAIAWGEIVGDALFKIKNPNETKSWESFGHYCWIEEDWEESSWEHCFDFLQSVDQGTHPAYENMGIEAYLKWRRNK